MKEKKQTAKDKLPDAELLYQTAFNQSPDGILVTDTKGNIIAFNDAANRQLGYSREEFEKLHMSDIEPDASSEQVRNRIKKTVDNGSFAFEVKHRTKSGVIRDVHVIMQSLTISNRIVLHTIWRDITERKSIERSLRESEEKFRALFESAGDALFIIDMQGNILDTNTVAYERLGYSKDELLRMSLSILVDPSFGAILSKNMARMKKNSRVRMDSAHLRKDGSSMPVEINARVMSLNGKPVIFSVIRDITERKQYERALQEKTRQLEDLTENLEKRVEEEIAIRTRNEQMLLQQSKLAAMGEILGAVAHQWRQPLNVVGLIVQNIQEIYEKGKLDRDYIVKSVQKVMMHVDHMSETIEDFRNFYRPDKEKQGFDAMRAVGDVLKLFSAQLSSDNIGYRLTCHTHGKTFENEADIVICGEKAVEGFKNEFEHVVLNIINNARDAIIERRVRQEMGPSQKGLLSFDFYNTGSKVIIDISDNGGGIPSEVIGRIFHPYFTTKEKAKGTGLGLYMSKVIVEDHMCGRLSVRNNEQGAVFTIELPQPGKELHHENTITP
jgi:PAS domain S-box-containing protein